MILYGIIDKRVPGVVGTFTAPSNSYAARLIQQMDSSRPEVKFCEDFSLYRLAEIIEDSFEVKPDKQFVTEFETLFAKEDENG